MGKNTRADLVVATKHTLPDPWADPESRSTLGFCKLYTIGVLESRIGGYTFRILPGVWVAHVSQSYQRHSDTSPSRRMRPPSGHGTTRSQSGFASFHNRAQKLFSFLLVPYPDLWADPKSRFTFGFCYLHHRSIRVQNWEFYVSDPPGCVGRCPFASMPQLTLKIRQLPLKKDHRQALQVYGNFQKSGAPDIDK